MENELTMESKHYIEIIQILRVAAATVVFLSHFFSDEYHLQGIKFAGRFGVGIFFILSGFLLVYVDKEDVQGFFLKKIIRICPLYWLMTCAVFFIGMLYPSFLHTVVSTPINLIKSLLFIPFYSGNGRIYPLHPIGWTLTIEMFVYVLYYMTTLISKALYKYKILPYGQQIKFRGIFMVLILNCLVWIGIVEPSCLFTDAYCKYYMLYFAGGIVGALLWKRVLSCSIFFNLYHENRNSIKWFLGIGICLMMVLASTLYHENVISILALIIFVLLLMAILWRFKFPTLLVEMGNISYSFYLIHYFVVKLYIRLFTHGNIVTNILQAVLMVIICYGITVVLSIFCYKIVEKNFSKIIKSFFIRNR